jgi:hypothetical protein
MNRKFERGHWKHFKSGCPSSTQRARPKEKVAIDQSVAADIPGLTSSRGVHVVVVNVEAMEAKRGK